MADLETLLSDELAELLERETVPEEVEGDIDELAGYFGDTPRQQNPAMAQALAGTTDKSSHAYKAALRSVQRYRAGEGKERRRAAPQRLRVIFDARRAIRRITAKVTGTLRVSSDTRRRTVPVGAGVVLDASAIVAAHDAGDAAGAADAFRDAFGAAYGVVPNFIDVESLELGVNR